MEPISYSAAGTPRRGRLPRLTDRLPLGKELAVSPFALGATNSPATVLAAFEAGINFFFLSADMHWPIYEALRVGLTELITHDPTARERIVIAAVAYVTRPEFMTVPFEEVLEAFPALGGLDVLVAGGAYLDDFFPRLPVYERHRSAGHCGASAIGASFHERAAARLAIHHELVDIAFIRYNARHPRAREDLLPALHPRGRTLVYNFKSTLGFVAPERFAKLGLPPGYWQPRITDHYRFVLSRPEIDGVLGSLHTPEEVAELAAALEEGPLSAGEEEHLIVLSRVASGEAEHV